jgi:hypothetical protein
MAYINQPPDLRVMFQEIYNRLSKLETAQRFTAPNVNISTNAPTNPRTGDIFFDTSTNKLVFWNGTNWRKITDTTYP